MSLHNDPEHNDEKTIAALVAHGFKVGSPDILADAFRLGRASARAGWEPPRCAECDCKYGGAACRWILCDRSHSKEGE